MAERHELRLEHLAKRYGKRWVVRDISFAMQAGEIVGLLGPNGAGKTTSFYMVVGFIHADRGRILLDDHDITRLPMYQRARKGLSYLPQEPSVFRKLSVRDNIRLVVESRTDLDREAKKRETERLMEEFGITRLAAQKGYTLSGGERRRCEIARALGTNPNFLLLDEPFAGIDPKAVFEIKQLIRQLSRSGIGVLLTDHNVRDTLAITDRSYLINDGTILVSGTKDVLLADPTARDIYFGNEFGGD